MGLFNKLRGQIIDVIEWTDNTGDTIAYRFKREGNEIKTGAQLTVRESQVAVFVNEGKIADVFPPGRYELTTKNLPLLTTLNAWMHGFNSPFKAEVYFLNTKKFTNQKWGTPNVFYIRDADFGRVSLRAFGTYTMRISDPVKFVKEILGTSGDFTTEEITGELRNLIVTQFIDAVGESGIPLLDMAQNYKDISDFCQKRLGEEFKEYGLEITKFLVSSISLPENLQEKLDEGTGMNMLGDMDRYSRMKTADAMEAAAGNPAAGGGMEGMMGMAMMQQMMNQNNMMQQQRQEKQNVPPPPPLTQYFISYDGKQEGPFSIETLKQMITEGKITKDTYVWKQGMPGWLTAAEVSETAKLFGSTPPVPPPPPPAK
ncbi:MAG: DUF4339 domain-containing protein [Chlorobi bacterium]|nr:DUF4339 domain-containing protein [Chlorobiota bacterium]